MIRIPHESGRPVAVLGLGKSGLTAARALAASGAEVWAWDDDARQARPQLPTTDLYACDWTRPSALVLSPGIPIAFPSPIRWRPRPRRPAARSSATSSCCSAPSRDATLSRHHRHQRQIDHHRADRPHPGAGRTARSRSAAISARRRWRWRRSADERHLCARDVVLPARAGAERSLRRRACCSTSRPIISTAMAAWRAMSPPSAGSSSTRRTTIRRSSASTTSPAGASTTLCRGGAACRHRSRPSAAPCRDAITVAGRHPARRDAGAEVMDLGRAPALPGPHNWQNAAAAYAAARALGIPESEIIARHRDLSRASPIARS